MMVPGPMRTFKMKIAFVSVENSLAVIGFRKMASLIRRTWPQLEVLHVVPFRGASPLNRLLAKPCEHKNAPEIDRIGGGIHAIVHPEDASQHADAAWESPGACRHRHFSVLSGPMTRLIWITRLVTKLNRRILQRCGSILVES
jgi:hypothetical protein